MTSSWLPLADKGLSRNSGRVSKKETKHMRKLAAIMAAIAMFLGVGAITANAATDKPAPVTPATTFHGLPGNNPAHGGSSANPQGNGANGGNGIHDIQDGAPGKDGTSAAGGNEPPSCTIHGGLGAANQNCN